MRHKKNRFKLSRPTDQRLALIRGQVAELLTHGYINTTMPRAKATQRLAERLITRAKRGTLADIRNCASNLPGKQPLKILLTKVAPASASTTSGFTQIAKLKYRRGDGSLIVRLSLRGEAAG